MSIEKHCPTQSSSLATDLVKKRAHRVFRLVNAVVMFGLFGFLASTTTTMYAQQVGLIDTADDALKGYNYPWYDADADQLKPLEFPEETQAWSVDRDSVALAPAKPVTNNPNPVTAPTGPGNFDFGALFPVFMIVLLLIVLGVLAYLFSKFLQVESLGDQSDSARRRKLLSESIEQLPFELQAGNGDFRSMAQAAYTQGDLRQAIIYLYSHVLVTLDQNELIRLRKGKTNRQYLKEVWSYQDISAYFKKVMLPFESVFFGDHELERREFEQCWSQLDSFHKHVEQKAGGVV